MASRRTAKQSDARNQYVSAVLRWDEGGVVALDKRLGSIVQVERRQRGAVRADEEGAAASSKSRKRVEHACAEIGALLRKQRYAELLGAGNKCGMFTAWRAPQGYGTDVGAKRRAQSASDQSVLQLRRTLGAKMWNQA